MAMLPQTTTRGKPITAEHERAAAADMLLAARREYDQAYRQRDEAIRSAVKHLSRRRIAALTGWDRGTVARALASGE
jgi:hypothetical protein